MFKLFEANPARKLEKQYLQKLEEARNAQRLGQIPLYATLTAEAEEIGQRLDALKQGQHLETPNRSDFQGDSP